MKKFFTNALVLILFATSALAGGAKPRSAAKSQAGRPNIVFILADDLDEMTMPYWEAMPQTAALVRDRGVQFTQAFSPTPICCPARSSILTGKYGHNTGVLNNTGAFGGWGAFVANGNEQQTMAAFLQGAGYRTGLIGKYLNGIENEPLHIPQGWSEWYGFVDNNSYAGYNYQVNENGTLKFYGTAESDYVTDVVAGKARDFINRAEANDGQPFFLYVSPTAPHLPLPPAPRHKENPYRFAFSPRLPNYNEAHLADKSSWLKATGEGREALVDGWNDIDYRNRMGSLYALDEMVASIVNTLEANGERENTLIVFTSDNGYNLGAHRLLHKMAPYEESIRVPLVIAGPGIAPRREDRMALEIDFAPTFLELAGVAIPETMDGRSLSPLLGTTPPASWRTNFIAQYLSTGDSTQSVGAEMAPGFEWLAKIQDIPSYKALRSTEYTYIEWRTENPFAAEPELELYDLRRDPYQLFNLLSTPFGMAQYRGVVEQMQQRLRQLESCKGASCQ
ncbi:MAG: sulfatase [Blastocatellia bacterium]|nr:sulfatase [Blastocatellia bacterium]